MKEIEDTIDITTQEESHIQSFAKGVSIKNAMLFFPNTKSFLETVKILSSSSSLQNPIFSITTLKEEKTKLKNKPNPFKEIELPEAIEILLNQDGAVQIGDTIVMFHYGYQYFIASNKSYLISNLKKDSLPEKANHYEGVRKIKIPEKKIISEPTYFSNGRSEGIIYLGENVALTKQHQYQTGGHTYKIVFELANQKTTWPNGYAATALNLGIKVEYRQCPTVGPCQWPAAGEVSNKIISNLNIQAYSPFYSYSNVSYINSNYGNSAYNSGHLYNTLAFDYYWYAQTKYEWYIPTFMGNFEAKVYPHYNQYTGNGQPGIGYYREVGMTF
jgi:hypothetical protein